jgi:malonyl-CoA O-methyltransferase
VHLKCEYLPATGQGRHELVMLHGWGASPAIWRTLLVGLRPRANIRLVEIPGCAPGVSSPAADWQQSLEQVLEAILELSPPAAVFVGWSLGGQLALALAERFPGRVAAVVTLATNPRFLAGPDWDGMPRGDFGGFRRVFESDPDVGQRRFDALQAVGSPVPAARVRQLRSLTRRRPCLDQRQGLDWLEMLDQRNAVAALTCPQLHILAEGDALVPVSVARCLGELLAGKPAARVEVLDECSHLLTLDRPDSVNAALTAFLRDVGTWQEAAAPADSPDKRDIALSFSRAAPVYDSVAQLQRDVGAGLLQRLDALDADPAVILDLGCGTGHFQHALQARFPDATYIGLDIASGMVEFARNNQRGAGHWLVADAETLPLAGDSIDLVFSSLAIQWCYRPELLFAELARVLRPGGRCVFTTLGPGTLRELREAWAAVDKHQHVNRFLDASELNEAASPLPGVSLTLESSRFRMEYHRVRDLLTELKTLGAHNMNRDRPGGLTSRRALQGMVRAYEQWREGEVLPATYDVILGTLERQWERPGL